MAEQPHPTPTAPSREAASLFRTRDPARELVSAERRVAEYLRALGLVDPERVDALSARLVRECTPADGDELRAEKAVAHTQHRVETFLREVFGARAKDVQPLWLRAFLEAHPEAFLGELAGAREAAHRFGDPWQGRAPTRARFAEQRLGRAHLPRWLRGLLPPLSLTAVATTLLLYALARDGLGFLEAMWCALFAFLFGYCAQGFFVAWRGLRAQRAPTETHAETAPEALPRSAVVMPIYHEDAEQVFAAIAAMRESLQHTPGGECVEIFVLSDSRDPVRVAEEERAWRRVANAIDGDVPVFYRRRVRNEHQKSGNVAEFLERWGHRYEYAIVLDADSLMTGETMVELLRRMHRSPQLGLLQAPLMLHQGETLFARAQQFAGSISGPLAMRGLAAWSGDHGNYYGHNAVVRVRAFLDCCALPILAGKPPLGGHILSHDFVEAALLCRADWHVRLAPDLAGSWEELPPTLPEYVARDRRWCQGNLQHLRVLPTDGLAPMSRIHMLTGVAAYLAGPGWFAFIVVGLLLARSSTPLQVPAWLAITLTLATLVLLMGPRVLGFWSTLRNRQLRALHGGGMRLLWSTTVELLVSAALAPLMMVHHTAIVASILLGRTTGWGAQARKAATQWGVVVRSEWATTLVGAGLLTYLLRSSPELLGYLSPLWVPLTLAVPLAGWVSSRGAGRLAAKLGLFRVPSETQPHPLALHVEEMRALTAMDESSRYRDLVLDPLLVHAQLARLPSSPRTEEGQAAAAPEQLSRLRERALRGGPAALSRSEWEALIGDAESLRWLHREAWRQWPVETWDIAREQPQLPSERPHTPRLRRLTAGAGVAST